MSRPSSFHGASHRDISDDFSLPLFAPPQRLSYAPPQAQHQQHVQNQPLPPPPPAAPPRSPARQNQQLQQQHQHQQQQQQQQQNRLSAHLNPATAQYATAPPTHGFPSNHGHGDGSSNGSAAPSKQLHTAQSHQSLATAQRQSMHFPTYAPSAYPEEIASGGSAAGGSSALGSLARSASLGTARRKDPFSYPSDDVESGMAGDWGAGAPSYGRVAQQMPQPYVNTNTNRAGSDVTNNNTAPRYGHSQQQSSTHPMPPPPLPNLRGTPSSSNVLGANAMVSSPVVSTPLQSYPPTLSPNQPSNPYVPRAGEGGAGSNADAWNSYRRNSSHHSPQSGSVSPLGASPRSPGLGAHDPSPHLLTPQGSNSNLPPSPRISYPPPSPQQQQQQLHGYQPTHRSHSSSFTISQPVTPSARYDQFASSSRHTSQQRQHSSSSPRQGFKTVRDWSDLKPRVNANPAGRRADTQIPGRYMSPLKCLTAALPQTYTLCNPTFKYETSDNPRRVLTKPSKPVYNDGADNEDWDYILYVNDVLGGEHGGDRYLILDVLGQGTFGQVVKCQNMRTHEICAVKVVKNKPAYLNQSKMEVAILNLLNREHDPRDEHHILRMIDSFTHKSHLCLVFECLSSNLYELIKQNQFKGLSLQLVRVFTQQLLECLAVLKDARLIHCDLKPENILLKSLQSPQIKVIDFGSACHELQTVYTYIQSRFYRSPEVLLGLPYSTAIDMWSLGCIVVELFLGLPIFPGTSEYNQVSRIVDMMGLPPQHLLEMGKQTNEFFNYVGVDAHGRKQYKIKPMEQYASEHRTKEQPSKQYFKQTKLTDIIMEYPFTKKNAKQSDIDKEMAQRRAFINFVEGLLNLDPIKRWTPLQASKHPFITGEKYTGPYEPQSVPTKRPTTTSSQTSTNTPTTPSSSKKYGGLVQSPASTRTQRVYSDAAAYNHQLAQHQYQTAQAAAQQNAVRPGPFSPGYDAQQQQQYTKPRVSSQHGPPPSWHQPMAPPAPAQSYHPRIPSGSHGASQSSRQNVPIINAPTNPPPNSYFPSSRNRANTINQMDAIPPALARLTNLGAPDPSNRTSLTPVLHREDMVEAWERRQQGAHKHSGGLPSATYPQLEFLQEQAELVNMNQQGYVMPGQYGNVHGQGGHGGHHRASQSFSGTQSYQMQPPIGHHGQEYRSSQRPGVPPLTMPSNLQPTSDYDPPSSSRSYLPAFPPPAATSQPPSATFDAFDNRDSNMGLLYTPLQPTQAANYAYSPGHAARQSYSGPYGQTPQRNNPFAPNQASPNSPRRYGGYGAA